MRRASAGSAAGPVAVSGGADTGGGIGVLIKLNAGGPVGPERVATARALSRDAPGGWEWLGFGMRFGQEIFWGGIGLTAARRHGWDDPASGAGTMAGWGSFHRMSELRGRHRPPPSLLLYVAGAILLAQGLLVPVGSHPAAGQPAPGPRPDPRLAPEAR